MKKILALLIVLCLLGSCLVACNSAKYDDALKLIDEGNYTEAYTLLSELGDYKDAKALLASFYYVPVSGTFTEGDETLTVEFLYTEDNLPLRTVERLGDEVMYTADYTYNDNLDLVKIVYGGGEPGEFVYTYDDERRLIKEEHSYGDGDAYSYEYTYDEDGNCIRSVFWYSDGGCTTDYTYEDGILLRTVETYEDGEVYTSDLFYDEAGKLVREEFESQDGLSDTYTYIYDENGNMIEEHDVYSDGESAVYIYTYDEKGNKLTANIAYTDNFSYSYEYTYDENGNLTKLVYTDPDGVIQGWEREYKLVYIPCGITEQIERVIAMRTD